VPPLILQPFVENAIWHGLQEKKQPGKLLIHIDFNESELTCIIEDNGIGIQKKLVPGANHHQSSGISITKERLALIHDILHTSSKFSITDRAIEDINVSGTKVKFNMPYITE
jgi:sensor histidine kinase YesM